MPAEIATRPARSWDVLRGGFRPDIEGLRGVAVLLVVAFHAGVGGFSGGFVGVDVFFVLSGYLITALLVRELTSKGHISFRNFYARRVRRLLPTFGVVFVVVLVASYVVYAPFELVALRSSLFSVAGYVSNLSFARHAQYFGPATAANPFLHTWSLAVEEQFYLVWPLLLLATTVLGRRIGRERQALWTVLGLLTAASLLLCIWLTGRNQPYAFFLSPPRFWEFAIGGLAVLLPPTVARRPGRWALVGLAVVIAAGVLIDGSMAFPGYLAAVPVIGTAAILIGGAADPLAGPLRYLATRPMQWLGRMSYAWYLWHWPVLRLAEAAWGPLGVLARLALALASLGASALTVRLVERPIRFRPTLMRRPLLTLAVGATIMAFGLTATYAVSRQAQEAQLQTNQSIFTASWALPKFYQEGCDVSLYGTATPDGCEYGSVGASESIVLFGDSHAGHWFPALQRVADASGAKLLPFVKDACPSVSLDMFNDMLARPYTECTQWRRRSLDGIVQLRPRVVVLSNNSAYVAIHPKRSQVTPAAWQAGLRATASRLTAAGIRVVVITDIPRGDDGTICLARQAWDPIFGQDCSYQLASALNPAARSAEAQAVAGLSGVTLVSMNDSVCSTPICPVRRGDTILYRDTGHLTVAFSRSLGDLLGKRIGDIAGPSPKAGRT